MAAELGRFVEGRPIRSRRLSMPERIWRWSRRNPALAVLSLLAAALTAILVIGSVAAAWTYREQRDAVAVQEQKTGPTSSGPWRRSASGRPSWAGRCCSRPGPMRYSGQPGRRSEALETLTNAAEIARDVGAPPEHLAALRDEVIAALALDDRPGADLVGAGPAGRCPHRHLDRGRPVRRLSDPTDVSTSIACRTGPRSGCWGPTGRPLGSWPVFVPGGRFLTSCPARRHPSCGTSSGARCPPPGRPMSACVASAPTAGRWRRCGPTASCASTTCRP